MPARINKFLARATGLSRRAADRAISEGRVHINGRAASLGDTVNSSDKVSLDGHGVAATAKSLTVMLNKPPGYVCSRRGQGSRTIYDLLPPELHGLKPVGRLDKDSSGLLLLTNDGDLANQLTHPTRGKAKVYEVELDKPLELLHQDLISGKGVQLEDGRSSFGLIKLGAASKAWQVTMAEGRNRQIRRTFSAVGYRVTKLRRVRFGPFELENLAEGEFRPA